MKKQLLAALAAVSLVSACGGVGSSSLNPFNWGKGRQQASPDTLEPKGGYPSQNLPEIPQVAQVLSLKIDRNPGGVIVRATGLPPTQGYWDGQLKATNDGEPDKNGVLTFQFLLVPPPVPSAVSTKASREVTVATYVDNYKLRSVRRIVVEGANNSLSARR